MSRTIRKRTKRSKKLRPYTKDRLPMKFATPSYEDLKKNGTYGRPTKEMKLEVRNANRSFKKGVRQRAKKQIEYEIQNPLFKTR